MLRQLFRITLALKVAALALCLAASAPSLAGQEPESAGAPKNLVLIIGDGMGPQQIGLLEAYATQAPGSVIRGRKTAFSRILDQGGVLGLSMTHSAGVLNTESASAATQLALGKPSGLSMVGVDSDGSPGQTLLELAKVHGKSTGLVSDVRLTHATPAAFAAHQPHRDLENEIAADMLASGTDVMLSGGLRHWIPQQANDPSSEVYRKLQKLTGGQVLLESRRQDERNLLLEAQKRGYQLAFTRSQLQQADDRILGLFASAALPDAIAAKRQRESGGSIPALKEMSARAIDVLSKNPAGFVLVIEAGLIDWAAHYNDAGTMLHEMMVINEVIDHVLDWAGDRADTLVVVTSDHETGGFGFSYSSAGIPPARSFPGETFPNFVYQPGSNYGDPEILDRLYAQQLSYTDIFSGHFDVLPEEQRTPRKLMELVNRNTAFDITESQAARILETGDNPYYVEGHGSMGYRIVPKIDANPAFFSDPMDDNRQNLLAMQVADQQSIVWSNGNHTATPVPVFAIGPSGTTSHFIRFMNHPQLGQLLRRATAGDL